jgi:hypothetical protein
MSKANMEILSNVFPYFVHVNKQFEKWQHESITLQATISGIHLILLGLDAFLLAHKALYFGGDK